METPEHVKAELLADADQRIAFWTATMMEKPSERVTAQVMITYWLKRRADLERLSKFTD